MNKFLQKLAKIFLGLSMAAGVGVAIGAGHKDASSVNAAYDNSVALLSSVNLRTAQPSGTGWTVTAAGAYCGSQTATGSKGNATAIDISYAPGTSITNLDFSNMSTNRLTVSLVAGHNNTSAPTITVNVLNDSSTVDTEGYSTWTKSSSASSVSSSHDYVFDDISAFNKIQVYAAKGTKAYLCTISATFEYTNSGGDTPTTFTVTYHNNNATSGSVPTDNTAYDDGDTVTVLGNTGSLARTGYTWSGWALNSSGTGTAYGPSPYTTTYTINSANVDFYPIWTEGDSVTVSLSTNSLSIDKYVSTTASLTATATKTGSATLGLSAVSSDPSVATVSTASPTSGTAFTITGLAVGSATITVTSTWDNTTSAQCTVTVTDSTPVLKNFKKADSLSSGLKVLIATVVNGNYYYLSSDLSTGSAPAAVSCSYNSTTQKIENVDYNMVFEVGGDSSGWSFTSLAGNYLYVSGNDNNRIRVGPTSHTFTATATTHGYYMCSTSYTRYVGVYSASDWRCYNSRTAANYKGTDNEYNCDWINFWVVAKSEQTISGDSTAYTDETVTLTSNATSPTWSIVAADTTAEGAAVTSGGVVSATGAGTVKVKATHADYEDAEFTITFSVRPTSPFITPAKNSTSGYTGQNESLSFTYGNLNGSLSVSSDNTSVVTVGTPSASDGSGTVQLNFVGAGSTDVKFYDGSTEMASVSVSVTASSVTISGLAATGNVYTGKTLNLGGTITVTAVGSMSNAVTWESDDPSIATVSAAGLVTGVAEGTVDITVTADDDNSVHMTCSVTVTDEPLQYVMNFGANKNTNPTEIKTDASFKSTWSGNQISDVTVGDFQKIYGVSSSQLKCGSGSATASISFAIPSDSYITSVIIVVETAGGTSMNVVSGATSAQTENQSITAGTLTFDDYLATEKSNSVLITSTASGAFYLSSITIRYANFAAELTASPSSFDVAVNSSQNVTLQPSHFTPTSYSAVVKSGSSLTASAVTFDGNVATIATGSSTGITVFTITGTGGGKSASVDVTVDVTEVRNLLTLSITTASDASAFKVGDTFDVGSLAITATFDADPTTVVFSKANGNIGLLDSSPAIGYEFQESDIGVITSVIFELKVGTGDEYVEYSITVSDKTYAAQVTDVQDLWDGQQIYFGNGTDKVNIAHAGGNQLGSQDATIHETKGLCVDDLTHDGAYTVHREKIDSVIYYSFYKDGYYLEASNTSNNYLTRTTTLSDNCRYTISISSGEVTMTNKGNTSRPEFRWNSGSNWFSQYQSGSTLDKAVIYAIVPYSEEAVAESFEENWLHMSDYTTSQGWCADEEHAYYSKLKPVWAAMGEYEKSAISSAGEARLIAWATANGETLDNNMDLVAASRISVLGVAIQNANTVAIIVIISMVSVTAIGGYFFLRKRKENI